MINILENYIMSHGVVWKFLEHIFRMCHRLLYLFLPKKNFFIVNFKELFKKEQLKDSLWLCCKDCMTIYRALVAPSHAVPVEPVFQVYAVGMQFMKHFRYGNVLCNKSTQSHCALVSLYEQHLNVLSFSTRVKLKISVLIFTGVKFDVFYLCLHVVTF